MYWHNIQTRKYEKNEIVSLYSFVEVAVELKMDIAKTIEFKGYFREVTFP